MVSLYLILACCIMGVITVPVSAADASIEAELGDTLNLHGVSYTGDRVYLFLTGPGLPENGVTLTDISQRADQGHFTLVDLDSTQHWSFRWDTLRLLSLFDSGASHTYTVYVSTEPVDKAHLGGSNTYQTLDVYLKDSGSSRVSISSAHAYTLNPELHVSTMTPTTAPATAKPTEPPATLATPAAMPETSATTTVITPPPPTKAPSFPVLAVLSVILGGGIVKSRRKK
jgi:hypothetical protein